MMPTLGWLLTRYQSLYRWIEYQRLALCGLLAWGIVDGVADCRGFICIRFRQTGESGKMSEAYSGSAEEKHEDARTKNPQCNTYTTQSDKDHGTRGGVFGEFGKRMKIWRNKIDHCLNRSVHGFQC